LEVIRCCKIKENAKPNYKRPERTNNFDRFPEEEAIYNVLINEKYPAKQKPWYISDLLNPKITKLKATGFIKPARQFSDCKITCQNE